MTLIRNMAVRNMADVPFDEDILGASSAGGSLDNEAQDHGLTTGMWDTPEGIGVRDYYGNPAERGRPSDESTCSVGSHVGTMPGFPPYVRGPYPTMYVTRPWTISSMQDFRPLKKAMHSIGET